MAEADYEDQVEVEEDADDAAAVEEDAAELGYEDLEELLDGEPQPSAPKRRGNRCRFPAPYFSLTLLTGGVARPFTLFMPGTAPAGRAFKQTQI